MRETEIVSRPITSSVWIEARRKALVLQSRFKEWEHEKTLDRGIDYRVMTVWPTRATHARAPRPAATALPVTPVSAIQFEIPSQR